MVAVPFKLSTQETGMFLEILCLKDVMRLEEEEERKSATTMFMTLTEIYYIIIFVIKTEVLPISMVERTIQDCLLQNRIDRTPNKEKDYGKRKA